MEKHFWKIENYQDEKLVGDVKKVEYLFWLGGLTFVLGAFLLCFGFAIKPAFTGGKQLPLVCWTPQGNPSPFYEILYAIHAYILWIAVVSVGGFDVYFTAINIGIVVQFKILRYELENLIQKGDRDAALKLRRCVQHHQFLLEYVAKLLIFELNYPFSCVYS